MAKDRGIRAAALIAATIAAITVAIVLQGRRAPVSAAEMTLFEQLVTDSSVADSVAFATLPPSLASFFDVQREMAEGAAGTCELLESHRDGDQRRRVRLAMRDSGMMTLEVMANSGTGALARVEFTRRTPGKGQRRLIWDGPSDRTVSIWWNPANSGVRRRAEQGNIPRGGPVPRVLRALGRQLLTEPCAEPERTPR